MAGNRNILVKQRKPSPKAENRSGSEQEETGAYPVSKRRRRRKHNFLRASFRLAVAAALIVVGVYVCQNWNTLAPDSVVFWMNEKLSGGQSGDGFPVEITGSSVLNMTETNHGIALLTDTSLVVLNSKGGEKLRRQHGYSNPILRTAGKWMLVADTGGNRLRVETLVSTAVEKTVTNHILSASINKDGCYAVVTDSSQGYTSEVLAYNRKQEVIYHWVSKMTILDAAISPNGKSMALLGVAAEAGAMKSSLLLFDFNKKDPVAEFHSSDLMLFSVGYFPGGTVAAVGDRAVWVFNKKGTIQQKYSYEDHQLAGYAIGESAVAVALRNFGSSDGGSLMAVNSSGDKAYTVPFEGTFRNLSPFGAGMLVLTSEHLYRIDAAGVRYAAGVTRDGRMISPLGNKVVILGLTSLDETVPPSVKG